MWNKSKADQLTSIKWNWNRILDYLDWQFVWTEVWWTTSNDELRWQKRAKPRSIIDFSTKCGWKSRSHKSFRMHIFIELHRNSRTPSRGVTCLARNSSTGNFFLNACTNLLKLRSIELSVKGFWNWRQVQFFLEIWHLKRGRKSWWEMVWRIMNKHACGSAKTPRIIVMGKWKSISDFKGKLKMNMEMMKWKHLTS